MKTLRFIGMALVAVIMSVSFAACSDDDEDPSTNDLASYVKGEWKVVDAERWQQIKGTDDYEHYTYSDLLEDNDGPFANDYYDGTKTLYSVKDGKIDKDDYYFYKVVGNNKIYTDNTDSFDTVNLMTYTVTVVNENKMILDSGYTEDDPGQLFREVWTYERVK